MGLVNTEGDDRDILRAEDEAIRAAANAAETVDGGTVHAAVGSPLASLIEVLNDDTPTTEVSQGAR